jgi:hypothetical protein
MSNKVEDKDFRRVGIAVTTKYSDSLILSEIQDMSRPTDREVLYARAINLMDEQTKNTLIELGWTPPPKEDNRGVKTTAGKTKTNTKEIIYTRDLLNYNQIRKVNFIRELSDNQIMIKYGGYYEVIDTASLASEEEYKKIKIARIRKVINSMQDVARAYNLNDKFEIKYMDDEFNISSEDKA